MKPTIALLVGLMVLVACGDNLKKASRSAANDVIDCASAEALERAKEYAPSFELLLTRSTTDDGKIDLPTLDTATKSLSDIGWCAVEKTFAKLLALAASAGAPQSDALAVEPAVLRSGLETLRAQQRPGKTFVNVEPGS